jgi:hypothetical protein
MNFFSDKPELLGNTQTLLGVLVTLIVLCLFNNESNFLLKLIRNMVADFAKNLQEKMNDIWEDIREQKSKYDAQLGTIVTNRKYWVGQAKKAGDDLYNRILLNNKQEQDILSGILDNLNEPLKKFDKTEEYLNLKRENIFVSLFFLILLISILMIDACCVSNAVGSLFLSVLTFISTYFTVLLWYRFFKDKEADVEYPQHNHIKSTVIWGIVITILLSIVLLARFWFGNKEIWFWSFGYLVIMVALFSYKLMHNFRYCVRYNNQFIIKHSFYIMFFCAVITMLLFVIRNIPCDDQLCCLYGFLQNIHHNIDMLVVDAKWAIRVFIVLATCNTFFFPLLVGYYYNHKKAIGATHQMEMNKQVILKRLESNIADYQTIIKDIQTAMMGKNV